MKKIISVIYAAALALSLVACDKTNGNSESGESSPAVSNNASSAEQSAPAGGDNTQNVPEKKERLSLLCEGGSFPESGVGTEDGYYSLHYGMDGDEFLRVTYVDYASGQEVMLCSDSSCKHDSERCTSILGNSVTDSGELFYYGKYLYYLKTGFDNDGTISTPGPAMNGHEEPEVTGISPVLYRMNPDGTGRETVYTFGENEAAEHIAVGDENSIWFITKTITVERNEDTGAIRTGSKNRVLVRLDLSERKLVEQIPISDKDNIDKRFLGVRGSEFIFSGIAFPDGKKAEDYADELGMYDNPWSGGTDVDKFNEFMKKCEYAFFTLNAEDKTLREIHRETYDVGRGAVLCGNFLYINTEDGLAKKLDLDTRNTENFSVPSGYEFGGFIGGRSMYVSTDGNYRKCFADPNTEKLIAFENFKQILAVNSDSALVAYDYIGTRDKDGDWLNVRDSYALISLDDLYNGRENFEPVKMIERSL